ncbi:MAG: glycosyltransferase [Verrucomicrobiae bacterium]|nr:glycosyltransferase [Verrucomicrobiae bacterium]
MSNSAPSLLILIPAYNEEDRIEPTLRDYAEYFRANYHGRFEMLVVLNGCTDGTLEIVQRVAREFPEIRADDIRRPIGKGGALIEGLRLAPTVDWIGYVDADGATPPEAFHGLLKHMGDAHCVIGSRWMRDSVLHQVQPFFRRFASRVFHVIVELLFWMHVKDTQCPAKVARRQAIEKVHEHLRIADLAFDVNLIYSLKHERFEVLEVPVEWTDKVGSKVSSSFFRSSLVMFLSVVRLRLYYSPLYGSFRPLRKFGDWLYIKLHAPPPLRSD